jgi:hypothetical protein
MPSFPYILSAPVGTCTQVDKPDQYQWDRKALLSSCVGLLLRVAASPAGKLFVEAVAAEPDMVGVWGLGGWVAGGWGCGVEGLGVRVTFVDVCYC